jgi:hypothetical protein
VQVVREALKENLRGREIFTSSEVSGLTALSWEDLEQFVTAHKDYSREDLLRDALASKFLGRFHAPKRGIALLPKLAGKLYQGMVGGGATLFGVLFPEALVVIGAGIIAALFGGSRVESKVEDIQLKKWIKHYKGLLQRKRNS